VIKAGSTVGGTGSNVDAAGAPSAADFWGGTPVGVAELDPDALPHPRTEPTESARGAGAGVTAAGSPGGSALGADEAGSR
jgi:hypothetical protein